MVSFLLYAFFSPIVDVYVTRCSTARVNRCVVFFLMDMHLPISIQILLIYFYVTEYYDASNLGLLKTSFYPVPSLPGIFPMWGGR